MTKQPFTYAHLLSTISPAASIAVYEDGQAGYDELYKGVAIKSRDKGDLMWREVRHVGINERNKLKEGERPTLEIFLQYDDGVNRK